ncbi:hypothetical protein [Amycolatopsis sp. cmx-4-68]|uniref:hypothetical protein n=1 Tax=Amycolatopsis sp. cmx-4-68 TaxID=2790938 RepID=UPI003978F045
MTDVAGGPFGDLEVLGAMAPGEAAGYLRRVGEAGAASRLEAAAAEQDLRGVEPGRRKWPFNDRPWQYTAHALGFIPAGAGEHPIRFAGAIEPDLSLRDSTIKITLDRLRVADYPGGSVHRILFDFYARNQTSEAGEEHLHFNSAFRVLEGQDAAVIGYPLFVGLNVGKHGVALRCLTVNVKNETDEKFLEFLESDAFRGGLRLVKTAQPVIAPFSEMALGLTKAIAGRHRNVPVQEFYLGLDFTSVSTGARLAQGSYVVVQIPDRLQRVWDWNEWIYDPATGQILYREDRRTLVPFNYIVFGVSAFEGG